MGMRGDNGVFTKGGGEQWQCLLDLANWNGVMRGNMSLQQLVSATAPLYACAQLATHMCALHCIASARANAFASESALVFSTISPVACAAETSQGPTAY